MADLHQLLAVQQHDTAADQLRHRRANLPERRALDELEAELRRLRGEQRTRAARREELGAAQAALETEVDTTTAKRTALERKLAATSVPREAQALSAEIDGLRERARGLEDRELEIMEELEPLDAELADLATGIAGLEVRAEDGRRALTVAEAEVDAELHATQSARTEAAASLPEALLQRYEKLRAKLGGVAVATLDRNRCTGCNLSISQLELDRIRHEPADALVECEQCGRLLVR